MDTIQVFEDMLHYLEKHAVRYQIIGALAFIYHAKSTIPAAGKTSVCCLKSRKC